MRAGMAYAGSLNAGILELTALHAGMMILVSNDGISRMEIKRQIRTWRGDRLC